MFFLQTGEIVPGSRIGPFKPGMGRDALTSVSRDFRIRRLPAHDLYMGGDIWIWCRRETDCVTQIMVYGDFGGKLFGRLGIGSRLCEIEDYLGERAQEELDVYMFPSLPGICFELAGIEADIDEWRYMPVTHISVF